MKRTKLISLVATVLSAATCYAMGTVPQPTLNQALAAPAIDLAHSYLSARYVNQYVLPAAEAGITIHLPGETITKSNVEEYRRRYQEQLSIYREAIKQRGYRTISGVYRGNATEACTRIQSAWVGLISEGRAIGIEITQDDFDVEVIVSTEHAGKRLSLRNQAAIAESSIALQDEMNSDYFFLGTINNKRIEIKPDVSVLQSWPKWAGPPSLKDLENCSITLETISN